jgi:threonine aldolase
MATKSRRQSAWSTAPLTPEETRELRARCDRAVSGHGWRTPRDVLGELDVLNPDELASDMYGYGGSVAVLEDEVRQLLAKPAAVFMPSGTMIQQAALRIHADRRSSRVIAFHPTCHLELHEDKAYQRLHGLIGLAVGDSRELVELSDLQGIHEPIAALLLELPQREIGGRLPGWDDLVAQVAWAHDHGAAAHMDGARLWECSQFYGRSYAEIAALFDSVYVSFYKGIGGTAGGMLLGDEDFIAEAREWRHRHGGTLFNLWPYAASALAGLRIRLPLMPTYCEKAQSVATALMALDGVEITPDPPQTPMMHIYMRTTEQAFNAGVRRVATERGLWTWGGSFPSEVPGYRAVELYAGDATLAVSEKDVADAIQALMAGAR